MKKIPIFFLVFVLFTPRAQGFLSQGYNIEQLTKKADKIFMGEVTKVDESEEGSTEYPYVEVYFKVFESLKGSVPSVFSFRQFAPKVGKQYRLMGMGKNSYAVGDKLVMFLGNPSSKGLTAPIDLQLFMLQTKSSRQVDLDKAMILNRQLGEIGSTRLFDHLENPKTLQVMQKINTTRSKTGGVRFQDFRQLIRASIQ